MIGTKLGPYEILEKIGAGGMGEVYRARDARLGRDVAVKVLPATLTADAERLRRFEQESRAAGVLNHPNILAIYDVGTQDGVPYVVSELLEGETLRERLAGSALPYRKAVELAAQVAHGLAAAHEKGIVHRDLKPENLFVTRDGRAKILDFGLAKLTQVDASNPALTDLPTTPVLTDAGRVLGTAGYMSPEQVRGHATDQRSDIFSFGAILYEMLTGNRAFRRDSAVETMNAILKEEPPEIALSGKSVPPALERIVRHCLEKRPQERFQSARDLAFDLEALSGSSEASTPKAAVASPSKGMRRALAAGAAMLLLAAAAWVGYRAGSGAPRASAAPRFEPLTFRRGIIFTGLFTPDGQSVLYGAAWEGQPFEIFQTRPGSPESRSLGLIDAEPLAVSRTGELAILLRRRMVLGWQSTGTLARMPISGGAPREIAEDVSGADWDPQGNELLLARGVDASWQMEYPPGKTVAQGKGWASDPRFSRDGKRVAFIAHPQGGDDRGTVDLLDLASGERKTLTEEYTSAQGLAWSAQGDEILFTSSRVGMRTLRAVTPSGAGRVVVELPGAVTLHDVFSDGRMLLTSDFFRRGILIRGPAGAPERDLSWLDWSYPFDLTKDGRLLLFDEEAAGAGEAFYAMHIRNTDGSPAVRIGEGLPRAFSPDGKWVLAVQEKPSRHLALFPTGPGMARAIPGSEIAEEYGQAFFPDGKRVLTIGSEPGKGSRLWELNIADGKRRALTPEGTSSVFVAVSPDGRWVALNAGRAAVAVYPVEEGEARTYPVTADAPPGRTLIGFTQDGAGLYLQRRNARPGRIEILDLKTGAIRPFMEFSARDNTGILEYGPCEITPDGQTFAYSFRQMISTLYLVDFPRPGK